MKILLATSSFAPSLGGVQTVVEEVAVSLLQKGYTVKVLSNRVPLKLPKHEEYKKLHIERIWFPNITIDFSSIRSIVIFSYALISFPLILWRLYSLLKKLQPDIINIHHPQTMMPFFQLLRSFTDAKIVTSLHGYDVERFVPEECRYREGIKVDNQIRGYSTIKRWLSQSDCIIANSAYTADIARSIVPKYAPNNLAVIHNAINPRRFQQEIALENRIGSPFMFAFGRFDRQKGFDLLLLAFAKIKDQIPHHLVIAGSGPEEERYKELVSKYNIGSRVHFPGRAKPVEVVTYLQAASFVVVPSRWEAFGITALEALAAGKAVVATNVGGIPEFASFPYCFISAPLVEELAQQILVCASKKIDKNILIEQQNTIWEKYNWSMYFDRYEQILLDL